MIKLELKENGERIGEKVDMYRMKERKKIIRIS